VNTKELENPLLNPTSATWILHKEKVKTNIKEVMKEENLLSATGVERILITKRI